MLREQKNDSGKRQVVTNDGEIIVRQTHNGFYINNQRYCLVKTDPQGKAIGFYLTDDPSNTLAGELRIDGEFEKEVQGADGCLWIGTVNNWQFIPND